MAKKTEPKKTEPKKEKHVYINVSTSEHGGGDSSSQDDGQYSGYEHSVIEVNHWGPVYLSEEGKGYDSHQVYNVDSEVNWSEYKEHQVWIVYIRYSDGVTFGRTEGYFNVEYITDGREKAAAWMDENKNRLKKAHSGYFESFEGIDVEVVQFKDPEFVKEKSWF